MSCCTNRKVLYPIAKNKVLGATKISDTDYNDYKNYVIPNKAPNNLFIWTLTTDDYLVAINRNDNSILEDWEYFCFICY